MAVHAQLEANGARPLARATGLPSAHTVTEDPTDGPQCKTALVADMDSQLASVACTTDATTLVWLFSTLSWSVRLIIYVCRRGWRAALVQRFGGCQLWLHCECRRIRERRSLEGERKRVSTIRFATKPRRQQTLTKLASDGPNPLPRLLVQLSTVGPMRGFLSADTSEVCWR